MQSFVLTCCSTADMPAAYLETRGIPYVCFHFSLDGTEYPDDLGKSISFETFYKRIADGAEPSTSQVTVGQYRALFEPLLKEGKDILHVTLSSGISGSYNSARIACEELRAEYPERKLYLVDSLGASSGYGLLVDALADMRDAGANIEEAHAWAEENKLHVHHWFFSTDLTSYLRGGRISKASYAIGYILNICPLLNMNNLGKLIPRSKCRGKKRVTREIVERMKEHAEGGLSYSGKCFISNSACYEDALAVAELVEASFPNLNGKVMINHVGTVIGSHTGPGTVALFFFGDERVN